LLLILILRVHFTLYDQALRYFHTVLACIRVDRYTSIGVHSGYTDGTRRAFRWQK
jgi:hypothetical protein